MGNETKIMNTADVATWADTGCDPLMRSHEALRAQLARAVEALRSSQRLRDESVKLRCVCNRNRFPGDACPQCDAELAADRIVEVALAEHDKESTTVVEPSPLAWIKEVAAEGLEIRRGIEDQDQSMVQCGTFSGVVPPHIRARMNEDRLRAEVDQSPTRDELVAVLRSIVDCYYDPDDDGAYGVCTDCVECASALLARCDADKREGER